MVTLATPLLVNGRVMPAIAVYPGSTVRLRVINASISRYYRLAVDGHVLWRVAGDSGLLAQSQQKSDVLLVPGERAELVLVVQAAAGTQLLLRALPHDRFVCGGDCQGTEDLMSIRVVAGEGRTETIPSTLALGRDGLTLDAKVGTTELWTARNVTDYDHPFHLHGFRFQVLEEGGASPRVGEWKDTLNVAAQQQVRLAIHFDDRPGMWMFHCHILDHADLGMMGMLHLR
jgi:FtsP/CotA-like multicopper oxidase with cupredoxin domain